jgi:hypothetical protein
MNCGGIRKVEGKCTVCNTELKPLLFKMKNEKGEEYEISSNTLTLMGAEGRFEDYVYLNMLENEWRRPISKFDELKFLSSDKKPSAKAIIALIFWIYFETRIERLLTNAMRGLPESISQNLLKRYQSISSRIDDLYKVIFGKTNSYYLDLENLGFKTISEMLQRLQDRRNKFMHGEPEAIDDELIEDIVSLLKEEHEGWVNVFNLRVAHAKQLI